MTAVRPVELTIRTGTELPTLVIPWEAHVNGAWTPVNLTGLSFILRLADATEPGTTLDEIDSGFTGADGTVTINQAARLAIGALNTSNTDTLRLVGQLTADPSGDPRGAELRITVLPALEDIP